MTPKEKAKEIIGKMCGNNCTEKNIKRIINYALIAANEVLNEIPYINNTDEEIRKRFFWIEVIEEINKL